jgi:hypothetical protein
VVRRIGIDEGARWRLAGLLPVTGRSPKKVPAAERSRMLKLYRETYRGWNVKHFHEHLTRDHGFRWGYSWVKTQLYTAGRWNGQGGAGRIAASASASRARG